MRRLAVYLLAGFLLANCVGQHRPAQRTPRKEAVRVKPASGAARASPNCGLTEDQKTQVHNAWRVVRDRLRADAHEKNNYPLEVSELQLLTASLLQMAQYCDDRYLLGELAELYLAAAAHRAPDRRGRTTWPAKDREGRVDFEVSLYSTQFLSGVAQLFSTAVRIGQAERGPAIQHFVSVYQPILRTTVLRWVGSPSAWTWPQCGVPVGHSAVEAYPFAEYVRRLRNNCAGDARECVRFTRDAPKYCNMVKENELFVAQVAAEYLATDETQHEFLRLEAEESVQLARYVRSAMALFESRLVWTQVTSPQCPLGAPAYLFDPNGAEDHPAYSRPVGYWAATRTAWELSHARRFVQFLDAMYRHPELSQPSIQPSQVRTYFANMLACKVFNGDFHQPRFANFIDGSNVPYYIDDPPREYPPWARSATYMGGGYPFLAPYNPILERVNARLLAMLDAKDELPFPMPTQGYDVMNFRAALARAPSSQRDPSATAE